MTRALRSSEASSSRVLVEGRIPMNDLRAHHAPLAGELGEAVLRTLGSARFILGPEVEEFERAAAEYLGVGYAIGVSSGTDALLVSLAALGVGVGDEVVTTPFTFFATVEAILRVGARPRFVDIERSTLRLDVRQVARAIGGRTRAIIPVHLYGDGEGLEELVELADHHRIPIVEDAAQAFGSRHRGRALGTWGTCGCFSFFPTKVLGALGDAGLVTTHDPALAARIRTLRQHGLGTAGEHVALGGNFRLDAMQAAVLRAKLSHVERWIGERRAHAEEYDGALSGVDGVQVMKHGQGWNGAIYTLRVEHGRRDSLRRHLDVRGIETRIYYERPAYRQPALRDAFDAEGLPLPESEFGATEVLSLPLYPELRAEQRDRVVEAITTFFR